MSVEHYENFPVASLLLPRNLRRPIAVIYRFARSADDIADEGQDSNDTRLLKLAKFEAALADMATGKTSENPLFADLATVIRQHHLPVTLFNDLLSAFKQDVTMHRYADFQVLRDYCQRSANPVGRLVLHLSGQAHDLKLKWSDYICSGLQLANFWQDVAIDWGKGRIYLPLNELTLYDLIPEDIGRFVQGDPCSPRWRDMMRFQTQRTRKLLQAGRPLVRTLPGRLRWEIALTIEGGLRILEKIDAVHGDVFRHRPTLTALDWVRLFYRALRRYPLTPLNR